MAKYKLTLERVAEVLAFRGVPSRRDGQINLLRAAGLEHLSGNGEKRGLVLENCPSSQLYAAARRVYNQALKYVPKITGGDFDLPEYQLQRCSADWRKNLRTWLNLAPDQAEDYSTADLEKMLCGE